MAEIKVERRRPNVWAWIIGLIVLALLIWVIAEIVDRQEQPAREMIEVAPQQGTAAPPPGAVPNTGR